MHLYAITLEAVTQRTITLAAASLAEAEATARDFYADFCHRFPADAEQLHLVEAKQLAEAA